MRINEVYADMDCTDKQSVKIILALVCNNHKLLREQEENL